MTKQQLTQYFKYLDELRASGATNMWGAAAWLERAFKLRPKQANDITSLWQKTFSTKLTLEERVKVAQEIEA